MAGGLLATASALTLAQALAVMTCAPAMAQDVWTGNTNSDWTVGGNWSGGVPGTNTRVEINKKSPNPTVVGVNGAVTTTAGDTYVGDASGSSGSLTIQNGSTLTTRWARIGESGGSTGVATITGAGSKWSVANSGNLNFAISNGGTGTLTISNGGKLEVTTDKVVMNRAQYTTTGQSTLNLTSGGIIETKALQRGSGSSAQANFDGGILRAAANESSFISGFAGNELNLRSGGLTIDTVAFAVTAASPFGGTGGLTKEGTGTLTLSTANTFSGGLTVNQGTVVAGNAAAFGTGTLTVATGATANIGSFAMTLTGGLVGQGTVDLGSGSLTLNPDTDTSFSGKLNGSGRLIKDGSGTLTLDNTSNGYSGGTTINAGTLAVAANGSLGSGALTINAGTLRVTQSFSRAANITLGASSSTISADAGKTLTLSGGLGGTGGLTKQGSGTLVLTGANNYQGATTISAGTLQIGNGGTSGNLGTGAVVNNATLVLNRSSALSYSGAISGSGVVKKEGAGNLTLSGNNNFSGGLTINQGTVTAGSATAFGTGPLTIGSTGTANLNNFSMTYAGLSGSGTVELGTGTLTLNPSGNGTFSGAITGTGSVVKSGSGDLTLSGINTFSSLTVDQGTVRAGSATAFGSASAVLTVNGGTADLANNSMTLGRLQGTGGTVSLGSATLTLNQASAAAYAGTITGTGSLVKGGTGELTLSKANSFSGGLTVNGGSVKAGAAGAFGSGSLAVASGTANFNNFAQTMTALSGAGAVSLGSAKLTVNQATNTVYSGAMTGTGGLDKSGAGELTLSGNNSFSGGLTVGGGIVKADSATAFGASTAVLTVNGGTANLNNNSMTFAGLAGAGGTVALGTATLALDPSGDKEFKGTITGSGGLIKTGAGTQTLSGNSTYTGTTQVQGGRLSINGDQTAATGLTSVASGATITGSGVIGGDVTVASGGRFLAQSTNTGDYHLAIKGDLDLATGSKLDYIYGTSPDVDHDALMIEVDGDINLNSATLDVTDNSGAGFDPGIYGLIQYTGTLSGALVPGTMPADMAVQTNIAGRVNLISTSGLTLNFWDPNGTIGVIEGGNGTWTAASGDANWTDENGTLPGAFSQGSMAIFTGTDAGPNLTPPNPTVTVDNTDGAVRVAGMQFAFDGYTIDQGTITLVPDTSQDAGNTRVSIIVGDRTGGEIYTTTIGSKLTGAAELVKEDIGVLVLTNANNDYSGGTRIEDGTIRIAADGSLGQAGTGVTFDGGTLHTTETISTGRPVTVEAGGGTFEVDPSKTLTLTGVVDGTGALTKEGSGDLNLAGANTFSGGLTISAGTAKAGAAGAFGSGALAVASGATVNLDGFAQTVTRLTGAGDVKLGSAALTVNQTAATATYSGVMSGTGSLVKQGSGTLILAGDNSYTGETKISAGTLQVGEGGASGTLGTGNVINDSALVFNRSGSVAYAGAITGAGTVTKEGSGDLTLSGASTFSGGLTVSAGTVVAGSDKAFGSGVLTVNAGTADLNDKSMRLAGLAGTGGEVLLGAATLTLNQASDSSYGGIVSGTGKLTKEGSGALTLSGANTFSGGLTVKGGQVKADSSKAFGSGLLTVDAGTADLNGKSMTLAGLAGSGGTVALGVAALTLDQGSNTLYAGVVTGSGKLVKDGTGTLTLSGTNTYFGGTVINDGSLGVEKDANLGNSSGGLTFDGGTLLVLNGFNTGRAVTLEAGGGTFQTNTDLTVSGVVSGAGDLTKIGAGRLILTGSNTYTGKTTISAGTLQVGSGGTRGTLGSGDVVNDATLAFDRSDNLTYSHAISGSGRLTKQGGGTLTLTGANSYGGTTTIADGTLRIGGAAGTLGTGDTVNNGALVFDRSNAYSYGGVVSGSGSVTKEGGGTLTLSGDNSYGGATTVAAGTLIIDGDQSAARGLTTVDSGGTLRGEGTIGGNVAVEGGGGLTALDRSGDGISKLTVKGDLRLDSGSSLSYDYGLSPNNDHDALMVEVGGDLHLDGTLNVKNSTIPHIDFDPGIYGLIHYDGALSGPGLGLGTMPSSDFYLQTSVSGRVSIVNTGGLNFEYWDGGGTANDGVVSGGSGVWQGRGGNRNWTTADGSINGSFTDNSFAAFQGTGGTVTVDNSQGAVRVAGMQFTADGYTVTGDAITLNGNRVSIGIGDNTANGAAYTTRIESELTGSAQLAKDDLGTLVLSGTNTYTGGTALEGGTLSARADDNLGDMSGALTFGGGTLLNTRAFTTARAVTLETAGGVFKTDADLTLTGAVTGAGKLTKQGSNTLTLTGNNSYMGGTKIAAGTVRVGSGGTTGTLGTGDVVNDGALVFHRANGLSFAGAISGTGTVTKEGSNTLILTGNNAYKGTTTITAGTLQIGNGGTTGSLGTGDTVNNGALVFDRAGALAYAGVISGSGAVTKRGSGVTTLSGNNSYAGATTIAAGTLVIDGDQSAAKGATTVQNGGTLRGEGTIGGNVTVESGGALTSLDDDDGISTLTIAGNLSLDTGSSLNYDYGLSPNNKRDALLIDVGGDLDLNGTLNVKNSSGVDFDPGIYGLIHYDGALSGAGLTVGSLPSNDFLVQTVVAGRINLINTAGLHLEFWDGEGTPNDGIISGGSGVWQGSSGNHNWTSADGSTNGPFDNNGFAIFQGARGTVTVDNSQGAVGISGMQFATDGYIITGEAITLDGDRVSIVVGDRTANGAPMKATIESELKGAAQLVKEDLGTLALTATNTYTGGTAINGGTLSVKADSNLGALTGGLSFDGGTLQNTGAFETKRTVTLETGGGTFKTDASLILAGKIGGAGALTKTGGSTLTLTADNAYTGKTQINAGTLSVSTASNLGASSALGLDGGTLLATGKMTLSQAVTLGVKGGTFKTDADLTLAGKIGGDGALTKTGDDTLTLTGDNDYKGGTEIREGTLRLGDGGTSGGIAGNVVNDGTLVFDRSDLLRMAGDITGSGAVVQEGIGTTELSGKNSYTGATTVKAGRLMAGAAGAFSATSDYSILAEAVLDLGGHDQTLAALDNAGTVLMGEIPGTTLTITGDYSGKDGTVMLNTELGDDDSRTDLLYVMGAASGSTLLAVTNIEGTGAHAVKGIKVVQVDGASDGTFTLLGDYIFEGDPAVVAGAYAYRLHQNGLSGKDGDWYLRSTLTEPEPNPHYQPGAPVYEAYGQGLLALNAIGTMRERLGNRLWRDEAAITTAATPPSMMEGPATVPATNGLPLRPGTVWGRIEAAHGAFEPHRATSRMDYDLDLWKLQAGLDARLYETQAGQIVGGLFAQYGTVSSDVSSPHGHGKTDTTGYGLGGTLTWFGADGIYVDGQAQAMWYDSDLSSGTAERDLARGNDGVGYALSLEAGKTFTLSPNWSLTPQAQIVYSAVDFDAFTDPFGARVALDTAESLKARAGIAADHRTVWRDANGQAASAHLYGIANLTYEMLDGVAIDIANTAFATESDRLWGGVGLGGTYGWADNKYALHGELALDTSLQNFAQSYTIKGNVELKMRW